MWTLDDRRLLTLWDCVADRHLIDRALGILAATADDDAAESPADLPIGRRDRRLLEIRAAWFGSRIETTAECDSCGALLEIGFDAEDVFGPGGEGAGAIETSWEGRPLRLRPATSRDLAAVAHEPPSRAPRRLVERLLLPAGEPAGESAADALCDGAVAAAGEALREASPDSEILIEAACSECGAAASLSFDPASQVWSEIDAAARRLLWEIHVLAGAYGWTEAEILALPASRRWRYLEILSA